MTHLRTDRMPEDCPIEKRNGEWFLRPERPDGVVTGPFSEVEAINAAWASHAARHGVDDLPDVGTLQPNAVRKFVRTCTPDQYQEQFQREMDHLDALQSTKRHKSRIAAQDRRLTVYGNATRNPNY